MSNNNDFDSFFGGPAPQGSAPQGGQGADFGGMGFQDPFSFDPAPARTPVPSGGGRWHWPLTLSAFCTVAVLSMGMAFLTRNMAERPIVVMGLIFMIPAAALMLGSMLVESATSAMTPGDSRKGQVAAAIMAVVATFLVGCLCDLIYLNGFKGQDRIVMVVDKSPSMKADASGKTYNDLAQDAIEALLDSMGEGDMVGAVAFENEVMSSVPLAGKTADQAARVRDVIRTPLPPYGGTDFYAALDGAIRMAEQGLSGKDGGARIVIITDGGIERWWKGIDGKKSAEIEPYRQEIISRCRDLDLSISGIQIGKEMTQDLQGVIEATGGQVYMAQDAETILSGVTQAASIKDKDLMRSDTSSAKLITFVMLVLEGAALGACLSIMLSRRGQFRFQYILSPVMGLLAFLALKLVFPHVITEEAYLWLAEGISLSLLGVVFMRRNDAPGPRRVSPQAPVNPDPFGF